LILIKLAKRISIHEIFTVVWQYNIEETLNAPYLPLLGETRSICTILRDNDSEDHSKKKRFFTKPKKDLHLDTAKEPLIVLYNKSFVQKVL
jgi:hypothetical protein